MIRKATARDASRLAEIQIFAKRTAYRPIFRDDSVSFNEMQVLDLALSYRDEPGRLKDVYVADDGIVRGMMRWGRETPGLWELKELYVDPFFQKQGYGHVLIGSFLTGARENRASKACLWVLEKNAPARNFYEAHGFRDTGVKKLQEGTTESLLLYEQALCAPAAPGASP